MSSLPVVVPSPVIPAATDTRRCSWSGENIKRHAYGKRIREVEYASFAPLVMSATEGLVHEATVFYKSLASLLST